MDLNAKINFKNEIGSFTHFWEMGFGSERPFMVLREENILEHYKLGVEELGFKYVRAHGIFHDDINVIFEIFDWQNNKKVNLYNWRTIDAIYDKILQIGLKPFVELSFMPRPLASGDKTIFYWNGNITLPKDFAEWCDLVNNFIKHLIDRYGLDEVRQWYFEVWNEPNLTCFFDGSQEDYFKLYDYTAITIKKIDNQLKVGGPSTAKGGWIEAFLKHCFEEENYATKEIGSPVDFVSYHGYPTDVAFYTGVEKINFEEIDYWQQMSKMNKEIVKKYEEKYGKKIEIHVTEWNSSANVRDLRHEDSNQAAFICKSVFDVENNVDSFYYWTLSDIFEEMGWPDSEFHGGFGLITINGVKKPAYNAFKMLRMLGNKRIDASIKDKPENIGIVATKEENKYQILLWNYIPPISGMEEYDKLYDMDKAINCKFSIEIDGLENSKYTLKKYLIDDYHSNSFTKWNELGKPKAPTQEQLDILKQSMDLDLVSLNKGLFVNENKLNLEFELNPASVVFIELEKK
ncbi:hypothetical protein ACAG39_07290 [Caldicellulosiruptoraceae bacterium PP1]